VQTAQQQSSVQQTAANSDHDGDVDGPGPDIDGKGKSIDIRA
jgi:hypothetical protein